MRNTPGSVTASHWPHHLVTHHKPYPGKSSLRQWTSGSVFGIQHDSFSCLWQPYTVHSKMTLWNCHTSRLLPRINSVPWSCCFQNKFFLVISLTTYSESQQSYLYLLSTCALSSASGDPVVTILSLPISYKYIIVLSVLCDFSVIGISSYNWNKRTCDCPMCAFIRWPTSTWWIVTTESGMVCERTVIQ